MLSSSKVTIALCIAAGALSGSDAFSLSSTQAPRSATALNAESPMTSRRGFMTGMIASVGAAALGNPEEASARYSSYARHEQDWEERVAKGEINYKTARDLRRELAEIVPENNDARSKIFCPNGMSSAVSPLMENKCGDRLAIPSVYGRTTDAVGNSIPGFATSTNLNGAGGFPSYK